MASPALLAATMVGAAAGCGVWDPLGGGGATVTFTATAPDGGQPVRADLDRAAEILTARAEAAGLDDVSITVADSSLTANVEDAAAARSLRLLAGPGQLRFRKVLAVRSPASPTAADPTPWPAPAPAASWPAGDLQCPALADRPVAAADTGVAACDIAGTTVYLLDAATVTETDVAGASADYSAQGAQWMVTIRFTATGQTRWTGLTQEAFTNAGNACDPSAVQEEHCQVAIVVDNVVVSAPTIQGVIPGDAQISGGLTKDSAELLAGQLGHGTLPVLLTEATTSPTP